MRPSHRSASYQFNVPTLEVKESEILCPQTIGGWQCHTAMNASPCQNPTQSSVTGLKNLGSEPKRLRTLERFESSAKSRAFQIPQEVRQTHTINIQRSLAYRIEMAKQRGDQRLLKALESESKAIALL